MADRWVNAEITLTVPMSDVSPDAPREAKQEAAGMLAEWVMDCLNCKEDVVVASRWEDMTDEGVSA